MTLRAACWDFDGTLADSRQWFFEHLNEVADKFGFRRVSVQELEHLRERGTAESLRALQVPLWKLPAIAWHMRALALRAADTIRLVPDLDLILDYLSQSGIQLAVVSSNSETLVRKVLGPCADWISVYACGASLFGKASKLQSALQQLQVPPGQAVYVGDEPRDVEAARRCGVLPLAVLWGYMKAEAFTRFTPPVQTFARPEQLLEWFGDQRS